MDWEYAQLEDSYDGSSYPLVRSDGVCWIPLNRPRPANFQQDLDHGGLSRCAGGILACRDVYPPGKAPEKTCFDSVSHGTNLAELGIIARKPRFATELKTLI